MLFLYCLYDESFKVGSFVQNISSIFFHPFLLFSIVLYNRVYFLLVVFVLSILCKNRCILSLTDSNNTVVVGSLGSFFFISSCRTSCLLSCQPPCWATGPWPYSSLFRWTPCQARSWWVPFHAQLLHDGLRREPLPAWQLIEHRRQLLEYVISFSPTCSPNLSYLFLSFRCQAQASPCTCTFVELCMEHKWVWQNVKCLREQVEQWVSPESTN